MIACCAVLASCAIRPLPENVAALNTYQIVQKVRCEARDLLRGYVLNLLSVYGKRPELVKELKAGDGRSYKEVFEQEYDSFNDVTKREIAKYFNVAIGFDFTFDITENNDFTASTDFLDLMTGGVLKLGLQADKKLQRQNLRNFAIIDSFSDLAFDERPTKFCNADTQNLGTSYPITGSLQLEKNFQTYFDLAQFTNLNGEKKTKVFADTMTFTTTLRGSINPSIDLSTSATNIKLDLAKVGVEVKRVDKHQLILSFAVPNRDAKPDELLDPKAPEKRTPKQQTRLEQTQEAAAEGIKSQRRLRFEQNAIFLVQ